MIPRSTARIAGTWLCSWGWNPDPGNPACENVALPGFDLCPAHEKVSQHLEAVAAQMPNDWDDYENGEWELKVTLPLKGNPDAVPKPRSIFDKPEQDPEYCPASTDHKHSECWYDCEPCKLCGDDSEAENCDCDRHRKGRIGAQA